MEGSLGSLTTVARRPGRWGRYTGHMSLRALDSDQHPTFDLGTGALVDYVKLYVDENGRVLALTDQEVEKHDSGS